MVVPSSTVAWLNIFIVPKHVKIMTSLGGESERMFQWLFMEYHVHVVGKKKKNTDFKLMFIFVDFTMVPSVKILRPFILFFE